MLHDLVADDNCEATGNPLTNFFSSFMKTSRSQQLADQVRLPNVENTETVSKDERAKIRSRSAVMVRQLYPDATEDVLEARMQELMHSLGLPADDVAATAFPSAGPAAASSSSSSSFSSPLPEQTEDLAGLLENDEDAPATSLFNAAYNEYYRHLRDMQLQLQQSSEYTFVTDNPFLHHEQPLTLGMQAYADGQLATAIYAFEAELQQRPSSEVWVLLGRAAADADMDTRAIFALEQAVKEDPGNLDALLALGVSYTNEHVQSRATECLWRWLELHPEYQDLLDSTSLPETAFDPTDTKMSATEELLIAYQKAAERNPADADVHTVVGVLCNILRDFDGAITAFEYATEERQNDYSLWNKLGASCANGGQPKRAVHAYQRALGLAPSYVRSWVNLGISLASQGKHQDAVVCFLRSLKLNKDAVHTWTYLQISFAALNRKDLIEKVKYHDVGMFADEFNI